MDDKTPPTASDEADKTFTIDSTHSNKMEQKAMEAGKLGKIWGSKPEKNIAGLVIFFAFILLGGFGWEAFQEASAARDIFSIVAGGLVSIITLALGYIFGSK